VRQAAVEALGNYLSDANARAVLERLAQADQDPAVRRAAAEVLKRSYLKPN
jgi:HEAT repeat protein